MEKPVFYNDHIATQGRCMDVLLNLCTMVDQIVDVESPLRNKVRTLCDEIYKEVAEKWPIQK